MTSRIFKILFIAVSVAAIFSGLCANESRKAKYIFLMIGDGMGSNHRAIASTYLKAKDTREVIDIARLNAEIKTTVGKIDKLRADIDVIIAEIEGGK